MTKQDKDYKLGPGMLPRTYDNAKDMYLPMRVSDPSNKGTSISGLLFAILAKITKKRPGRSRGADQSNE